MTPIDFNGEQYLDDRLYVMHVARCTVDLSDGVLVTTVHFAEPPTKHIWCVVIRKNIERWPPTSIKRFASEEEAMDYLMHVEPQTPLISLRGSSPARPMSYSKYCDWKQTNHFKEFDWRTLYPAHAKEGQVETVYERL